MEASCGGTKAVRSGTGLFIQVTNLSISIVADHKPKGGKRKGQMQKSGSPSHKSEPPFASRPWNRECRKSLPACQPGSSLRAWFPEKKGLEGSLEQRCSQQ